MCFSASPKTTAPPSHFAAVLVWRAGEGESFEFLVVRVWEDRRASETSSGETPEERLQRVMLLPCQVKFPGGKGKEGDQSPAYTAHREFGEETGLKVTQIYCQPIHQSHFPRTNHTKLFFLADWSDCVGELRTCPRVEPEIGRPDEILDRPVWVSAAVLLFDPNWGIIGSHREALVKALKFLEARRKSVQEVQGQNQSAN